MSAVDSSVVVAAFGPWHEYHEVAVAEVRTRPHLPAHVALEAYSVLTRLPEPFRAEPVLVAEYLRRSYPGRRLQLGVRELTGLPTKLAELRLAGGAVYDALIAFTVRAAATDLATLDRRAQAVYDRCGVTVRLLH
ncbi:MAG TPA: PIN domain-containing protein [Sporichthyaceae bacterium]|nr:PIN domain-containing protein [Sporichthyaceae bacterium]